MSMHNSKAYTERLTAVLSATEAKLNNIKTTYGNFGFKNAASKFTKSNVLKDLNEIRGLGIPEEEEIPSLGTVKGYSAVAALPLKGHTKNGVKYVDPNNPEAIHTANISNTLKTDRPDGNININRWTTRNIFKFKDEYYGYDRCVYKIPLADLANGIVIDGGEDTPHANTLENYPYPEEIIMISQNSERNFVHFINVQYSDGHYGHYNGRNYNFMIVKDRIRYGIVNETGEGFKKYTSVYANDVNTELAYIKDGYLFLPVPDEVYGEEMLDTIWDCRIIWRSDEPNRSINVALNLEENAGENLSSYFDFDISNDRVHLIGASGEAINKNRNKISGFDVVETPKKSIFSSFVMTNSGEVLIAPIFEESYKPFDTNTAGTPNQIFSVTNNHYIGFYYYNPSNRGNSADGDSSNRTSQLYFNLFDSTLKVISADESSEIYPCSNFNASFTNTNNPIIKVFPYSINKTTGASSFLVFTTTKLYKFNFTVSGNTLTNTSFEEVMSYTAAKYIMRISAEEFLIYASTGTSIAKVNINTKTSTNFTTASGNLVLGRNSAAYLANGNLSGVQYDSNNLSITGGTQSVNPSAIYNIHGKYGYFKNSSGVNTMCKLVENYNFDVELDPFVRYISFTLNGSQYNAEDGMTWSQWLASEENTTGKSEADVQSISTNGSTVDLGDVIIAGAVYEAEIDDGMRTVTITGSGKINSSAATFVRIDGIDYEQPTSLTVPIGTVILCHVESRDSDKMEICLNGVKVSSEDYNYVVAGDVVINLSMPYDDSAESLYGVIEITE